LSTRDDRRAWAVLRRDPGQILELAILYALPQLTPEVSRWYDTWPSNHQGERAEQLARRATRASARTAAYGGAMLGSSFYVGMVPAAAMIYCDQLVTVLRVAALFGHDLTDPIRAADILVIQGRYHSIAEASQALLNAGAGSDIVVGQRRLSRLRTMLRELLAMIGLQVSRFKSPVEFLVTTAEVIAFLIPIVSIPVWVVANMRTTERLGRKAIRFYRHYPLTGSERSEIPRPTLTARNHRGRFIAALALTTVALVGLGRVLAPRGYLAHHLPFGGIVLAEVVLVSTSLRLILLTRPAQRRLGDRR
jgi:hypothetical protein